MLLIACTLALLVIIVGMKFLAQVEKENLGNLYKYVAWFVVIMGFLCLLCIGAQCAMRHCHEREFYLMNRDGEMMYHGRCGMGYMGGCDNMMGGRCMMERGCNEGMMNGCGNTGNNCQGDECHEHMGKNCNKCDGDDDGGNCPMMNGGGMHMEKDSVIVKKEKK